MTPRVVIDPGVLISSLLARDTPPALLVAACLRRRFRLVTSEFLLTELETVLARPKFQMRVTEPQRDAFVAFIRQRSDTHADPGPSPGLTPDPGDDYLGALALSAGATHLVTGDKGLLAWQTDAVQVLTPRQFLDHLNAEENRPA